jgi:predicted dehydrogenase
VLRIGIVGAENSHSRRIAESVNLKKKLKGVRVEAIWGEKMAWAEDVAGATGIPTIVRKPEHLIGMVDAAIVDHRDGKYHLPAARPLLEARLPLFVDKPFCCSVAEGKRFLARARRLRVPVVSFGVVPLQKSFEGIRKKLRKIGALASVTTSGPADLCSKYSGVFFYGIHQIDMIVRAVGLDFTHARINRSGRGGTATMWYSDGLVATANLLAKRGPGFHFCAVGEKGVVSELIAYDKDPYLTGITTFVKMFRGGKPLYDQREILAPIAVLEALQKSLKRGGKKVKVGKF